MDPAQSTALLTVFGLGSAWGTFTLGPIIRQVTEDLAWSLCRFPGLVARPHHLVVDGGVDPNLSDAPDPLDERPRVRFILPHALPSDSLVRTLAAQQGTPLAVTGRLDIHRKDFELALNVWDTARPNLLYCAFEQGETEQLLGTLAHQAGRIGVAFGATDCVDSGSAEARDVLGTSSWAAYETYAAATDKVRNLLLGMGGARTADVPRVLCAALNIDPDFARPRLLLLEHATRHLAAGDASYAEVLLDGLNTLRGDWLIFGLLRFECLMVLGKAQVASALLVDLRKRFPGANALEGAAARLGAKLS